MTPKKTPPKTTKPSEDPLLVMQREIGAVRATLKEISQRFQLRWEAELAALQDQLEAARKREPKERKKWDEFADHGLEQVLALKLRPKRGRLKDLMRIRSLTREL